MQWSKTNGRFYSHLAYYFEFLDGPPCKGKKCGDDCVVESSGGVRLGMCDDTRMCASRQNLKCGKIMILDTRHLRL